ncbi:hypothetical protein C4D60_Mb09t18510 [Musa balbisiana]|uniref:Uncharacterized protein n=1 Tax=Musa balbisiana TaxID=52838 RepID=A0A4S8IHF5_MUSBA|nr:hypothetical protein C4D60_Mb09t18510 [Musa balbisiana]
MGNLPEGEAFDPLVARWGSCPARSGYGPMGIPQPCSSGQHYAMALKDRMRNVGRVIDSLSDRNAELHRQIKEIRAGVAPEAVATIEQHASDLEAEAMHLRARYPDLKVAEDPFASFPEDLGIDMPEEVPFEYSADVPEK